MGLSVVLAVKNEQDILKQCLEHVYWAEEIIIVDNGSTDDTLKIAKKFTKKIYSHPKSAMIPALQQFGIDKSSQEWVLVLDADVIVPEKAKKEIIKKIRDSKQNSDYVGYYLYHQMVAFGKPMRYALNFNILKLFKKEYGMFDANTAHSPVVFKKGYDQVGKIKNRLLHYSFPSISHFLRKMNLYTSQDAEKIVKSGKGGLLNKPMKRIGIYNLIIEPFLYTNYLYFVKKYCFDGVHGLVLSTVMGFYLFTERAKVLEIKLKKKNGIGEKRYD